MLQPLDASSHGEKLTDTISRCYQMKVLWDLDLMRAVAEFDQAHLYLEEGFSSTAEWLSVTLCMGYMRALEFTRIAVALAELPKMAAAYGEGRISYDHLRALVDVAGPGNEDDLLEAVEGLDVSHTFKLVRRILEVSAEDSAINRQERWLQIRWDHDNRQALVFAQLPEDQGAKFERAIELIAKQMLDDPDLDRTPMGTKRADALVALADSTLATHSSRSTLVVHVQAEALLTGKGNALIEGGPAISPETARRLSCDGVIRMVAENKEGKPLAAGRSQRTVDDKTRAELFRRDGGCAVPGCKATKGLEAHHIVPWWAGGPTDFDNLVLVCPSHHFLVEEGGWKIEGVPPKIAVIRPNGAPIKVGPPRVSEELIEFHRWVVSAARVPDS